MHLDGTAERLFDVGLTDEQLETYTVGSELDMLGLSSWSSDIVIAENFADDNLRFGNAVVFHCTTQAKGTAIRHLSNLEREDEVLVSTESRYRVIKVERIEPKNIFNNVRVHVYLEEV